MLRQWETYDLVGRRHSNDAVDGIVEGVELISARIFLVVCLPRNPHATACSHTIAWTSCSDFSMLAW
jgi:hypothetical protein